jgi:multiple sugar transport system permease protein
MKNISKKVIYLLFFVIFVGFMLFPFLFILFSSFKLPKDIMAIPPKLLPTQWIFSNYVDAFQIQPLVIYLRNSLIMSLLVVLMTILIGSLAAYALSRTEIKGKKIFLVFLLLISLLPPVTIINPIYQLLSKVHLLNTYFGLALVITVLELPLAVWFLTAFFNTIPKSLEESAEIDGANIVQVFRSILFPLVKSGIFTVSILVFIGAWNQFLFALVLNQFEARRMVTVGVTLYITDYLVPWGVLSAASIIVIIPLIMMVLALQKRILSGVLEGGVKE